MHAPIESHVTHMRDNSNSMTKRYIMHYSILKIQVRETRVTLELHNVTKSAGAVLLSGHFVSDSTAD